jgi:hypothetical protein
MGKNAESLIQCDIVKYLQGEKIYFFSIPNEAAAGNRVRQMQLISMGLRAGVSDMLVFLPMPTGLDEIIFVEVKAPKGKQSEKQKKFEKKVTSFGYRYYVVYSVSDMQKIVENHKNQYW